MAYNIYELSLKFKIPRVVMMSSIHVDDYQNMNQVGLINIYHDCIPDSPYGASKIFIEKLGQYYSQKYNLEVLCPRIGGVNLSDSPTQYPDEKYYDRI